MKNKRRFWLSGITAALLVLLSVGLVSTILFVDKTDAALLGTPLIAPEYDYDSNPITECVIMEDNATVRVKAELPGNFDTDDDKIYLFSQQPYEDSVSGKQPLASADYVKGTNRDRKEYTFYTDLNEGTSESGLYTRYVAAVLKYGEYVPVTYANYITNPEQIADHDSPQIETASKKGLQVEYSMVGDVQDLGIQQAFLNFDLSTLISAQPTQESFEYNGKTFYITSLIHEYDSIVNGLASGGCKITAALVCTYSEQLPQLRCPGVSYNSLTQYYSFNVFTKEGAEYVEAFSHFLAARYADSTFGQIDYWVIGNEVNDNLQYNYVGEMEGDQYVELYYHVFRVMYNAIKSANAGTNVYIPLEPRWLTANTTTDYGGKYMLNKIAEYEQRYGAMDWGVAFHPYPYPLGDPDTLDDGDEPTIDTDGQETYGGEVTLDEYTPLISMKNIDVLTDYFKDNLKQSDGNMRSIIVSEVGYTSSSVSQGQVEAKQAANIAYAYYKAEMNPYIDAFIIRAHKDVDEGSEFFQFGLWTSSDGQADTQKLSYNMYKYIDTQYSLSVTDFAKTVLGIDSWNEVIDNFDESKFQNMRTETQDKLVLTFAVGGTENPQSEGMVSYWSPSLYITEVSTGAYGGTDYPSGYAVTQPDINHNLYYSLAHIYTEAIDWKMTPYYGFKIKCVNSSGDSAVNQVAVRIRAVSGDNVYDSGGVINTGIEYSLFAEIGRWEYADKIERIEVWVSSYNTTEAFNGIISLTDTKAVQYAYGRELDEIASDKVSIENAECSYDTEAEFTGAYIKPELSVTLNGKTLVKDADYSVSYLNNKEIGTAQIVITGIGGYTGTRTCSFTINSEYGLIFNPAYYLENNADVAEAYGSSNYEAALQHFLEVGIKEGRQGNESFNVYYYLENYSDLYEAYGMDLEKYYMHYLNTGAGEGRTADRMFNENRYMGVDYSAVYDKSYFAEHYNDVANYYGEDPYKMIKYFVEWGMKRGWQCCENFDVAAYRRNNKDIAQELGDEYEPYYMHYINYGQYENRVTKAAYSEGVNYELVFDAEYYYNAYPDVAKKYGYDYEKLLNHFIIFGMKEGRTGSINFILDIYKINNPDLTAAYGEDNKKYYMHYIYDGFYEDRIAAESTVYLGIDYSAVYDKTYYYQNNADLRETIGDNERALIRHFVENGMAEGRQGSSEFNAGAYRAKYSDLRVMYKTDMKRYYQHYMRTGKKEGRSGEIFQ